MGARGKDGGDPLPPPVTELLPETLESTVTTGAVDADETAGEDVGSEVGRQIGSYRLLRKIGAGGMGAVYLAARADEQYEQRVAIKLLDRRAASRDALERFRVERQLLARLEHPYIARLYDGGEIENGRPYLVMEYVEGLRVDQYCDRHRLSIGDRLRLFRKICAAVEVAHQNLLVHRDLKPANLLITADGEPKLLDFGIAKLLDPGLVPGSHKTMTGQRLMTPDYASPEQVLGLPVSTASDVYSLGVVLFELLTGCSPYRLKTSLFYELERAICEQDRLPPSAVVGYASDAGGPKDVVAVARARRLDPRELRRRLRGDLDHVVLKALRRDPTDRYRSVEQMSEDVRRHLHDLPVSARQGSSAYTAAKFVRRHRLGLAALAAVGLLVIAFVAALWRQAGALEKQRDRAEQSLSFLVDLFRASDPGQARGQTITARQILDQGAERVLQRLDGQPGVRATLMDAIGQVYLGLGLYEQSEPMLEGALEIRRQLHGERHLEVADSLQHLGELLHEEGDYQAAEPLFRQALALRRELLGDDHLDVAETLDSLSTVMRWSAQLEGAEAVHLEALAIRRRLLGERDPLVAQSLDSLASYYLRRGEYERARELYAEAVEIQRATLGADHPDTAMTLKNLGLSTGQTGDQETAERLMHESLATLRATLGDEHPWVAQNLLNLAWAAIERGDFVAALTLSHEALELQRRSFGGEHPDQMLPTYYLGMAYTETGDLERAEEYLELSREITRRELGDRHPRLAYSLTALAKVKILRGDLDEAERLERRALDLFRQTLGDHKSLTFPLHGLARIALARGQHAAAEAGFRKALERLRRFLREDDWRIAEIEGELGASLLAAGRYHDAEPLLRSSQATLGKHFGAGSPRSEEVSRRLAELDQRRRTAALDGAPTR